jgi:hypothetical protein
MPEETKEYAKKFGCFISKYLGYFGKPQEDVETLLNLLLTFNESFLTEMAFELARMGWYEEALLVEKSRKDPDIDSVMEVWFNEAELPTTYLEERVLEIICDSGMSESKRNELLYKQLMKYKEELTLEGMKVYRKEQYLQLLPQDLQEKFHKEFAEEDS